MRDHLLRKILSYYSYVLSEIVNQNSSLWKCIMFLYNVFILIYIYVNWKNTF